VALDIGVHLELDVPGGTGWREGERWNAEIAWEFLRAHSSWDERQLRSELRRCLGLPGQAPSYKLGERIWLQAREDAMARAGAAFNLKDFSIVNQPGLDSYPIRGYKLGADLHPPAEPGHRPGPGRHAGLDWLT
jgi:hypothetical protein